MASDAEIAIAFVAKRQGKESMPASDWAHVLSLELGWMAPGAAKGFIADCQEQGLLVKDGDALRVGFDRASVAIPKRYRPPDDLAASPPSGSADASSDATAALFPALIERIAETMGGDKGKGKAIQATESVQERFGGQLNADAAAVLVALDAGLDVRQDAAQELERIKQAATTAREG